MPLAARLEDLDYGYTKGICKAARAYPLQGIKKDEIETALGYFEANAPRSGVRTPAIVSCAEEILLILGQYGLPKTFGGNQ
jgi:hypothetical protein